MSTEFRSEASSRVFIQGVGFGDAEVYVDDVLTYRLTDTDRRVDSSGTRFVLRPLGGSQKILGYVTGDNTAEQIARILRLDAR